MRARPLLALVPVLLATALLAPVTPAAVADDPTPRYAPLHRPGPALTVPRADLRDALECHGEPRSRKRPVLLSPATSVTPEENYGWNWMKLFTRQGRYWCAVTMPHHTFGDIQVAAEHHVFAIRTMHRRTGGRIAVLGHSQGGMNPRWALRFWPDLRTKVSDVVGMAPSNHGTTALNHCVEGVTHCEPAVWQQRDEANFMAALNSRAETFRGISYTNVYTELDEVVRPPASSGLHTGDGRITNVAVQEVCPTDPYEHNLMGTVSPTVHALVMDALRHRGPADPDRVDRAACTRPYMPGVDPTAVEDHIVPLMALPSLVSTAVPNANLAGAPLVAREPRLRCYVYADRCR